MIEYKASINSLLSLGATDGPGVRFVVFMQGCPLRCDYCHNPETWEFKEPDTKVDELVSKILRYKPYFKNTGGVTVSGGEPLCQSEFIIEFFKKLKEQGVHTCIDTSAGVNIDENLLEYTDLLLVDVKFLSEDEYEKYVGSRIFENVKQTLDLCKKKDTPVWIRHVLYPEVTDNEEYVQKLKDFCDNYSNIERVDLLPFKNLCQSKYDNLGMKFKMEHTKLTDLDTIKKLKEIVKKPC